MGLDEAKADSVGRSRIVLVFKEIPMAEVGQDSLKTRATLSAGGKNYDYYSLDAASKIGRAHV